MITYTILIVLLKKMKTVQFSSACNVSNTRYSVTKFFLNQVEVIFLTFICWPVFSSVDRFVLKTRTRFFFSQCRLTSAMFLGNMLRARKYRFALCFRGPTNQCVERSAYANVFKLYRENKRFERAKVNSRCFHWFPAAMLESLRRAPTWRLQ